MTDGPSPSSSCLARCLEDAWGGCSRMLYRFRVGEPYVCYLGMFHSPARRPGSEDCKILEKPLWLKGETWPNQTFLADKSSAVPAPWPCPTALPLLTAYVAIQMALLP